jgi:7-cyano-7-deazaguanine synthase
MKASVVEKKVLILLSGGIDSTACIQYYKDKNFTIETLYVDFGQPSNKRELGAIKNICELYQIKNTTLKVEGIDITKDGFIQGRNIFLISSALLSNKVHSGIIAIGVHAGTTYVDCKPDFVDKANCMVKMYSEGRIWLDAPFKNWSKLEIFKYCQLYNVPIGLTYSCELGLEQPCSICMSCKDLKKLYAIQN